MHRPVGRPRRSHLRSAVALALLGALAATLPASAFSSDWTKPQRVFTQDQPASHALASDASGKVHIATERGAGGVWYVTNASGSWQECQVSSGNDRQPSISLDGTVVHIAFARRSDGAQGIYTTSSDQPEVGAGCGWAITERHAGDATHPSMVARSGSLSIAFRTGQKKLRFIKGPAAAATWTISEVIDSDCCTSPVALALTSNGAARVAYGDGTRSAEGLKYGVRGSAGWKKSKVHGGRIKQVALVLDQTPGLFGQPPSDGPRIAIGVKKKGTYLVAKGSSGTGGAWDRRTIARSVGPLDLTHWSNVTYLVYASNGDLRYARASGGIWSGGKLSGGGRDGKPQLDSGHLTFTRRGTTGGIYQARAT